MAVDAVAASAGDLTDHRLEARFRDFHRLAAHAADDVMVVLPRRTGDVGVLAVGQVDPLELTTRRQQVERPEDRCPADAHVVRGRVSHQVVGREVAASPRDQAGDGTPRGGGTRR